MKTIQKYTQQMTFTLVLTQIWHIFTILDPLVLHFRADSTAYIPIGSTWASAIVHIRWLNSPCTCLTTQNVVAARSKLDQRAQNYRQGRETIDVGWSFQGWRQPYFGATVARWRVSGVSEWNERRARHGRTLSDSLDLVSVYMVCSVDAPRGMLSRVDVSLWKTPGK